MAVHINTNLPEAEDTKAESGGIPGGEGNAVQKLQALEERLRQLGSLMVAYSGGVDSAFLAATAPE